MEISAKDLLDLRTQKSPFAGGAFGKLYKIEGNSELAKTFNQTDDSVVKIHGYLFHGAKTVSDIKDKVERLKSRINSTFIRVDKIKRLIELKLKYATLPRDIIYLEGLPIGITQNYIDGTDLISLGFKDMPAAEKKLIIDALIAGQVELLEKSIAKDDIDCKNVMRLNNAKNNIPIQFIDFDDIATNFIDDLTAEEYSLACKFALEKLESMIKQNIEPDFEMPNEVYRNFKLKN